MAASVAEPMSSKRWHWGAKAVGIGRPYLWGMGAFGQAGVDRVMEILQGELKLVMGNCGTQSVSDIDHNYVI
jgi:4-hydroxymandelate oxidase